METLIPLTSVTLMGIRHDLDETGSWCTTCGELVEYLVESGGIATF